MIDDELTINVRVRIPRGVPYLDQVAVAGAISGGIVSGLADLPGTLTGIEFMFPTYENLPTPSDQP
jgi:hypothetical protein